MIRLMERRLFIALTLPTDTVNRLDAVVADIESSLPRSARLVPRENWHCTVLFLGGQDEELIPDIEAGMRAVHAPEGITVAFDRVVYGPPGRPPRMLWATMAEWTSEQLGALKAALESEFRRIGVRGEHGAFGTFSGHVTLARFDRRDGLQPIDERFDEKFVARDLALFESHLTQDGPTYEELSRSSL
jgi:2'-5' RNA ligase